MLSHEPLNTLLVIEDDEALRLRLARAMQKRGFATRTAASVADGLDAIQADPPDYAIVDLRLTDGSGLEVIEALEHRHPDARAVVLTGYGNIPTAVAAARIGAIDYLAKPATADEIVDALFAPKDAKPPAPSDPIPPEEARWEHIEHVFQGTGGKVSKAARLLKMHRRTLQRTLRRRGVVRHAS